MPRARLLATLAVFMMVGCKTKQAEPAAAAKPTEPGKPAPAAAPALPDPPRSADPAAPAAPAPAATADPRAPGIAAIQHLADTLTADGRDCDKLAVDLKAFIAENRPLLAQLMAAAGQPDDPQVADRAAAAAAARTLQTALAACLASPAVAAAVKDLPGP